MRKFLRWAAVSLSVALVLGSAVGFYFYRAITALPEAYAQVLQTDPEQLEEARQTLESNMAALYSDSQQADMLGSQDRWHTEVTQDQVNGWLANRLKAEIPELADSGVRSPRVIFDEQQLTLAFKIENGHFAAVVLLCVAPFVAEDDRLGIEIVEARIGSAKLPLEGIVEASRHMLVDSGVPLTWSRINDRPALMVDFEELASDPRRRRTLQTVHLEPGRLVASGGSTPKHPRMAARTIAGS